MRPTDAGDNMELWRDAQQGVDVCKEPVQIIGDPRLSPWRDAQQGTAVCDEPVQVLRGRRPLREGGEAAAADQEAGEPHSQAAAEAQVSVMWHPPAPFEWGGFSVMSQAPQGHIPWFNYT